MMVGGLTRGSLFLCLPRDALSFDDCHLVFVRDGCWVMRWRITVVVKISRSERPYSRMEGFF